MRRREFLTRVSGAAAASAALGRAGRAADELYVLSGSDPGRLKLDFNANRAKVRLLFMLSPT